MADHEYDCVCRACLTAFTAFETLAAEAMTETSGSGAYEVTFRTEFGCLLTNGQVFRHKDLEAAQQHVTRAQQGGYGDLTIVSRQVPVVRPGPWEPIAPTGASGDQEAS